MTFEERDEVEDKYFDLTIDQKLKIARRMIPYMIGVFTSSESEEADLFYEKLKERVETA